MFWLLVVFLLMAIVLVWWLSGARTLL